MTISSSFVRGRFRRLRKVRPAGHQSLFPQVIPQGFPLPPGDGAQIQIKAVIRLADSHHQGDAVGEKQPYAGVHRLAVGVGQRQGRPSAAFAAIGKAAQGEKGIQLSLHPQQAAKLRDELRTLVRRQLAARRAQRTVSLTRQDIAAVVSERTGIPVGRLRQSDRERLLSLRQTLSERIIGQQAAVDAVSTAVLRGRTGLADAGRPAASFLLIGPTGVGKTELCKQLAQVVYGSQDALIRVDMSEYMEPSSVSRLLGAPPGYVGYDAGGTLTEKVRRRPYCVVLFDELEKAHRDITGILLQLLGDGILTDSMGRTVSFKNTIVVMTSNLTGPQTGKPGLGFIPDCADVRAQTVLREAFSPEFLGRIDCVASFRPLAAEDLAKIAALQLRELAGRLQKQNVTLETAPELPERLGALCANEPGGARSLRRRLQTGIEGPAAELLLRDPSVRTLRAVWQQGSVQVKAAGGCF